MIHDWLEIDPVGPEVELAPGREIALFPARKLLIQTVKANARGYRSFDGFKNSILFYCGGLDMTP